MLFTKYYTIHGKYVISLAFSRGYLRDMFTLPSNRNYRLKPFIYRYGNCIWFGPIGISVYKSN